MDSNKLYNALLKSQERQKAEHAQRDVEAPAEEHINGDETRLLEKYRRERPFAGTRRTTEQPNWTMVDGEPDHRAPSLYDSSVSLDLINNPRPWSMDEMRERKIIHPGMANKSILDAFREVRIKLRDRAGTENFSVMMSSLGKKEPSAITAFNLAATFAMDSQTSALLVDCNPYQSDLPHLVSSPMKYGVTDFVAGKELQVKDILYPSGIDRLSVIPAGTQSTSAVELFSAVRMKDLMSELKGRYPDRYIVINAPPFQISTEARILVRYANQVVLGVPFGEVTPDDIMKYVETLGTEKFSGLIFQQ